MRTHGPLATCPCCLCRNLSRLAFWCCGRRHFFSSPAKNAHEQKPNKDKSQKQARTPPESRGRVPPHTRTHHQFDVTTHHMACTRGIFLCVLAACSSHARLPSASPLSRPNRVDAAGEDRDAKTRHDVSPSCLPLSPTSPKHTRRSQEAMPGPRLLSHAHSSLLLDLCCVRTHAWT